jgi:hypothetical protein
MLRAIVDMSTASVVAIIALNVYVVTLAIRAHKTSDRRGRMPIRH